MRSISEILSFVCMWQTAGYQSTPSWPLTTSRDRTPLPWAGRCTWGVPISTENKYDMMKTDAFRTNNGKVATWLAWNVLQTFVFEIVLKFVTAYQSATSWHTTSVVCLFVCLFVCFRVRLHVLSWFVNEKKSLLKKTITFLIFQVLRFINHYAARGFLE